MDNHDQIWAAQKKVTEKRGGNLCAPVPRGEIGLCGYINDVDEKRLRRTLDEYKQICKKYPRAGLGVDMHCVDVGLEPAGTVGMRETESLEQQQQGGEDSKATVGQKGGEQTKDLSYNEWIKTCQESRTYAHNERLGGKAIELGAEKPPAFNKDTLFHPTVEAYATAHTTKASKDVARISEVTTEKKMFAPCMVGQLEGQFLKMMVQMQRANTVLDIGTFTGYSALSFAEGLGKDGKVVTIENDAKIAETADGLFKASSVADKIELLVGDAVQHMQKLLQQGKKFDLIFLDADKANYVKYYEIAMQGLLNKDGFIMADNSLCALVYREGDARRDRLHEFNELVSKDPRVEQVCLTLREGVTIIRPTPEFWASTANKQ